MKTILTASALAMVIAAPAFANEPASMDVTLCQQAVKAQVQLEHDKAKIDFGDQDTLNSSSGASQVQVSGKGHFTRKDGTKKHFRYTCMVDSAAGRVLSASFEKVD
jgi:hypothetical protein